MRFQVLLTQDAERDLEDLSTDLPQALRIIYRVLGEKVITYVIVDGRRDMQSFLLRRLLGG